MARLFPDEYFHIGGDEVNGKQWSASADIQAFEKAHNMPGGKEANVDIHRYFNDRLQGILKKHGKQMEGWDEILNPDLPKTIVIQSWRGQKSLAEAARQGFTGILSSGYYLDHMEKAATLYAVDPLGKECADLTDEQKKLVLGGESCMWGEYVTPENIDGRIWPRNAVIAERLWSPATVADPAGMYLRMDRVSRDLEYAGLLHRSQLPSDVRASGRQRFRGAGEDPGGCRGGRVAGRAGTGAQIFDGRAAEPPARYGAAGKRSGASFCGIWWRVRRIRRSRGADSVLAGSVAR